MSQLYILSEDIEIRVFLEDLFLQAKMSFLSFERLEVMLQAIQNSSQKKVKIIWVPPKNNYALKFELQLFMQQVVPHQVFVFNCVSSETDKSIIENAGVEKLISLPTSIHEILKIVS